MCLSGERTGDAMTTKEILHGAEDKLKKALESVTREFSEIRTGRASPGMVEGLHVDYYGTPTLMKQLASITVPDPHMIMIQPWDISAITEIEKAIAKSSLGIQPCNDGKVVRLSIPQLSKERSRNSQGVHKMAGKGGFAAHGRRDAKEALKSERQVDHEDVNSGGGRIAEHE